MGASWDSRAICFWHLPSTESRSRRQKAEGRRQKAVGRKQKAVGGKLFSPWLCHSDARQVSDLPEATQLELAVYDRQRTVGDRERNKVRCAASRRLAAHRSGRDMARTLSACCLLPTAFYYCFRYAF